MHVLSGFKHRAELLGFQKYSVLLFSSCLKYNMWFTKARQMLNGS